VRGKPPFHPGPGALEHPHAPSTSLRNRKKDGAGGIGEEPVLDAKRKRGPLPRDLPRIPPARDGVKSTRRPELGRDRYGGDRVSNRKQDPARANRVGPVQGRYLGPFHDAGPAGIGVTDLKNIPAKYHLPPEKRPDKIWIDKRQPSRGEDAAQGRDGKRGRDRGPPENGQEEGEKKETSRHGGTARAGGKTEEKPGEEWQGKEQGGTRIPERMIHAGAVATPVPSRPRCWGACGGAAGEGGSERSLSGRKGERRLAGVSQVERRSEGTPPRVRKPFFTPPLRWRPGMKTFSDVLYLCPVYCFARRAR
jgi:hypothetical protein